MFWNIGQMYWGGTPLHVSADRAILGRGVPQAGRSAPLSNPLDSFVGPAPSGLIPQGTINYQLVTLQRIPGAGFALPQLFGYSEPMTVTVDNQADSQIGGSGCR